MLDALGSPVPGVVVAFAAATGGASGVFADTGTPATSAETGADGIATAAALTANDMRGAFSVTARAPGVDLPDIFFELGNLDAWYVAPGGDDRAACVVPEAPLCHGHRRAAPAPFPCRRRDPDGSRDV